MASKRTVIDSFRQKLQERNADSNFSNQFLYNVLMEHAKWLIKREVSSGRIYKNTTLFQRFNVDVIEVPLIDACIGIKTNCKIYRTKDKLPEMWTDNDGPIVSYITSIDGTTEFLITTPNTWRSKENDPYQRKSKVNYAFFSEGYFWFPKVNPNKVITSGFFTDDLALLDRPCDDCNEDKECLRFLDTRFMVPDWIQAEMFAKALEQVAGVTKRMPEDTEINKNPTRR